MPDKQNDQQELWELTVYVIFYDKYEITIKQLFLDLMQPAVLVEIYLSLSKITRPITRVVCMRHPDMIQTWNANLGHVKLQVNMFWW